MSTKKTYTDKNGNAISLRDILNHDSANPLQPRYADTYDSDEAVYIEIMDDKLDDIESYGVKLKDVPPADLRRAIHSQENYEIEAINTKIRNKNIVKITPFKKFNERTLAHLLARVYIVKKIVLDNRVKNGDNEEEIADDCEEETMKFGVYIEEKGIYETREKVIGRLARQYEPTVSFGTKAGSSGIHYNDVVDNLDGDVTTGLVTIVDQESNPYLIPCKNCIFDFEHKCEIPFSPDYVFIYRYGVRYVNHPPTPVCVFPDGKTWDFDTWISDLFNNDEADVDTCLHILTAVFMPRLSTDTFACLYNYGGSGGKGTLIALLEAIVGARASTTLAVEDFDKQFGLENAVDKKLIVCNENPVGEYIDRSANLKAAVTHDSINITRKHKSSLACKLYAFIIQCFNELPMIRDTSGSFLRRTLILEFPNTYSEEEKRPEIKDEFLQRTDVKEYIFSKLMALPKFTSIPRSPHCKGILEEFAINNNIVFRFYKEVLCDENIVPWFMQKITLVELYPVFYGWCKNVVHLTKIKTDRTFRTELSNIMKTDRNGHWTMDKTKSINTCGNYKEAKEDWSDDGRFRTFLIDCGLVKRCESDNVSPVMLEQSNQFLQTRSSARGYITRTDVDVDIERRDNAKREFNCSNEFWVDKTGKHEDINRLLHGAKLRTFHKRTA